MNLNIFKKKPVVDNNDPFVQSQLRESTGNSVFQSFNSEIPFQHNMTLFNVMRSNFPFIDAIAAKFVRLMGDFEIICDKRPALEAMNLFKDKVKVNHFQYGFDSYLYEIMDNSLALGFDTSEKVTWPQGIHRLKTCDPQTIRFIADDTYGVILGQVEENNVKAKPFERPEDIMYLAHDTRRGHPQGYSLFYSLPFCVQILERVYKAVSNTTTDRPL